MLSINTQKRRKELLKTLREVERPLIGSRLAEQFNVSRQVIVQDIALLRAKGEEIMATSQGYLIPDNTGPEMVRKTIACQHNGDNVREELITIVNHGAKIIDVIVEHPLYGELRGILMIQSPADVDNFMTSFQEEGATLLSYLTDGVHLHTIEAINEQVIMRIKKVLAEKGFLLSERENL